MKIYKYGDIKIVRDCANLKKISNDNSKILNIVKCIQFINMKKDIVKPHQWWFFEDFKITASSTTNTKF